MRQTAKAAREERDCIAHLHALQHCQPYGLKSVAEERPQTGYQLREIIPAKAYKRGKEEDDDDAEDNEDSGQQGMIAKYGKWRGAGDHYRHQ